MRKIFFAAILIISALQLTAQDKYPVPQFNTVTHNFGEILEQAGTVSYSFKVKNVGETPLIINRVATSCGCTASKYTKEPILPNSEGVITISYNPAGRPGRINQRITVFTNAPGSGIVLSLRGEVLPRPKTKAEIFRRRFGDLGLKNSHISFGTVHVNQIKVDTLHMYNFGSENITISFDYIPKHINIEAPQKELEPQKEGTIIVTFNSSELNDWGYTVSRLRVLVNGENLPGNIINVSARIEEDFSKLTDEELANAPRIEFSEIQKNFGEINEGELVKHEFVFKNTGKSDLIIRKIRASCGCTTVAPKITLIKPGEESSLSASFRTSGYKGRQSKSITVITNDPKKSTVVLRLTGTVKPKPNK
ncbi:MAG: DUF1573 domain-containing protein [Bacteroidales bacterium]|nr:DUF1573 domain-containing protein [Bacteroidales bacterium]MDD4671483.1 DUF1573 domain-containing protein [Bacteroidales bacterium]MDY0348523.1 DUF1573 domain-containing protein [Tenuifilaceae bacterium]